MVDFIKAMKEAKKGYSPKDSWRVVESHHHHEWVTKGGSTYAVAWDGNICGLCRNKKDKITGQELLERAIRKGGSKLQAFGRKLFKFYTKNGFRPISWCLFNDIKPPEGWKPKYGGEPLIFYLYDGKKTQFVNMDDFISTFTPSETEKIAYECRDYYQKIWDLESPKLKKGKKKCSVKNSKKKTKN